MSPLALRWGWGDLPMITSHLSALAYRDQILLLSTQTKEAELSIATLSPPGN